ncbi:FecR domain-containing protein [Rapidithrix thailandica]|uniref:FecR domain-containing protein n=1 Tax=Rapidithrix thailandica TaxID=413964 RepID=A0AAW9SIT3_9BACT
MDEIILKYLRNNMRIEDQYKLAEWLKLNQNNRQVLNMLKHYWETRQQETEEAKIEVWERLNNRIHKTQKTGKQIRIRLGVNLLRIAAVLAIALSVSIFMIRYANQPPPETASVRRIEKICSYGQQLRLQLPDGSKVQLNAGSKLSFPEKFTGNVRKVKLTGEAYFEIEKNAGQPFTVRSGELEVTVLGTSFNLRAYQEEENIQVAVNNGKVAVRPKPSEKTIILTDMEMAIYDKILKTTEKSPCENPKAVFSWKEKVLYFEKANFAEIIKRLEKWYGVRFQIDKKVDMKKDVSGEFQKKSLEDVLEGLSFIYEFEFEIQDNVVIIN